MVFYVIGNGFDQQKCRMYQRIVMKIREIATWCNGHQIPFITKFKYRKEFPIQENLWNLYNYV